MDTTAEFDIGPLTWVKGEIDQALTRALAALRAYAADPSDAVQLRSSRAHFHQAHGALQIVGLDGVARFSEEIEGLLNDIGEGPVKQEALSLAERGFSGISAYLEQLLAGQPNQPLRLFALYRELALARGKPEPDPVELYFPGWAAGAPPTEEAPDIDPDDRARMLHKEQVRLQRGLLRWLRGRDTAGAREIAAAIRGVERVEAGPHLRTFWWATRALAEGLAEGHVTEEAGLPRVWPRVERQLARVLKGAPSVAERLSREVLFHVARTHPATALLREVQHSFKLVGSVPEKFDLAIEDTAHLPRLRAMKDIVQNAKTGWTRYASGHTPTVAPFCEYAVMLRDRSAGLNRWDLAHVAEEMVAVADKFLEIQGPIEEGIALEVATALLLFEDAVEKFTTLPPEFSRQCQAMIDRLRLWREKKEITLGSPAPLLEDVARRAQERMAIAQLVAEIQSNLRVVEQALDAFFRDPSRRSGLGGMDAPLTQVAGALRILGEQRAAETLDECVELIRRFTNPAYTPQTEDFEYVAGLLSGVGFHADALQHGPSDLEVALRPVRDRHAAGKPPSSTVETELVERQRESLAQLEAWREAPADSGRKEELRQTLTAIKQDAGIVADSDLEKRAGQALSLLADAGTQAPQAELMAAVQGLSAMPEPVPAPSKEVEQLAESSREVIDAELLEIYLQEATEMLGMIHEHLEYIRRQPASPEGLPPIRRGFHTLKGSGRMVGLMSLADSAYAVEKVLNQFLEAARPATEDLMRLIEVAERYFTDAISSLKEGGQVASGADLVALAAQVKLDDPTVTVGSRRLPEGLFNIFLNEARSHMAALRAAHQEMAASGTISEDYQRAAHTLGGIAGTTNFVALHELAVAVEHALGEAVAPVSADARAVIGTALDALDAMVQNISRGVEPENASGIMSRLHALQTELPPSEVQLPDLNLPDLELPQPAQVESPRDPLDFSGVVLDLPEAKPIEPRRAPLDFSGPAVSAPEPAVVSRPAAAANDALPGRPAGGAVTAQVEPAFPRTIPAIDAGLPPAVPADEIDSELLSLFIDEGHELFPAVGTALRDWHAEPGRTDYARSLQRALHTLKGSARMAGAMGLGNLLHDMETLVENTLGLGNPPPEVIAQLEAQYDHVSGLFDKLQRGELPVAGVVDETAGDDWPITTLAPPPPRADQAANQAAAPQRMAGAVSQSSSPLPELIPPASPSVELASQEKRPARPDSPVAPAPAAAPAAASTASAVAFTAPVTAPAAPTTAPATPAAFPSTPAVAPVATATGPAATAAVPAAPLTTSAAAASSVPSTPSAAPAGSAAAASDAERVALLRVRADMVDRLVNSAGEVTIARSRIEGEVRTLKSALSELTENVTRLRHQLREIEIQAETQIQSRMVQSDNEVFDPLEFDRFTRFQELTRMMAESVNDVATVHGNINRALDETESALSAQHRLSRELQQDLLRVRMVPFASINERLYRIVRQAGKETGKRVALDIRRGQVELDRSVLERITAPFEHMLRNAVAHGLESPEERRLAGKEETGEVSIEVRAEGNQIALTVADDGRGLDLKRIQERAITQGLIGPNEQVNEAQLEEMIFHPGFSTAESVTQLAGRGVGMDIVRSEITSIGGRVDVHSEPGRGTRFEITLPLTLVVTQSVLVTAGGSKYVIPSTMVEQVRQARDAELHGLHREGTAISMTGQRVPFFYLPRLLGDVQSQPAIDHVAIIVFVRTGSGGAALQVDSVLGNQEIVVKNTGPMLARISGVTGATVLGSGEIVLILNPLALAQRASLARAEPKPRRVAAAEQKEHRTVLVVDDSLTVRRATERLLTREGFNVITARDGVNALEVLQDSFPAVMLVDIEMPRMDGFDLTRNVRADERLKDIPIIMITSRTAEKHRQVAFDLGVNAFLGKPYREDELLHHVRALAKPPEEIH